MGAAIPRVKASPIDIVCQELEEKFPPRVLMLPTDNNKVSAITAEQTTH